MLIYSLILALLLSASILAQNQNHHTHPALQGRRKKQKLLVGVGGGGQVTNNWCITYMYIHVTGGGLQFLFIKLQCQQWCPVITTHADV